MRNQFIYILLASAAFTFTSCGGGGSKTPKNDPPSGVTLQKPTNNQLCIDNRVEFDWTDATDPNSKDVISYRIEFASDRAMTTGVTTQTSSTSNLTTSLTKGKAYYWRVTAIDNKQEEGPASTVFAFYTKGEGTANAAPFSAKLEAPGNGDDAVAAGTVNLRWKGSDSDDSGTDLKYDVYFGETSTPDLLEENYAVQNRDVTVETGKTYYWKVNTIDPSGAKSIGQVWSFTVQ